jgi:hypothetical protein
MKTSNPLGLKLVCVLLLVGCSGPSSDTDIDPISAVENADVDNDSIFLAQKIDQLIEVHLQKEQLKPNQTHHFPYVSEFFGFRLMIREG